MAADKIRVIRLNVFPVKSCRAHSVQEITFGSCGVAGDRNFMIVDASSGRNVSQKQNPNLVSICPTFASEGGVQVLCVSSPKANGDLRVVPSEGMAKEVIASKDKIVAYDQGEEAAAWFTQVMEQNVRLVYLGAETGTGSSRIATNVPSSLKDKFTDLKIGLANSAPVSLASVQSLADVNKRLLEEANGCEVPLDRFRMNVEVDGCSRAFEEDEWQLIRIGGVPFLVYVANKRCGVICIDQKTGETDQVGPLKVLRQYRAGDSPTHANFGQYMFPLQMGKTIRVGDLVEVLDTKKV